jgi:hypothetical protein
MTYITNKNFFHEVSAGRIAGKRSNVVSGYVPATRDDGNVYDVWEVGTLMPWALVAEPLRLTSTSEEDDSLRTGMQQVLVIGLDAGYNRFQEFVDLAGVGGAVTENEFLRVEQVIGWRSGSVETNVGNITIAGNTTANVYAFMLPGSSLVRGSNYTVPVDIRARVVEFSFSISRSVGGATPRVRFIGYTREGRTGAPWLNRFETLLDGSNVNKVVVGIPVGGFFEPKMDMRISYSADIVGAEAHSQVFLIEETL